MPPCLSGVDMDHRRTSLKFFVGLLFLLTAMAMSASSARELRLTKYVDPFIGTSPGGSGFGFNGNTGDVFPGADFPRGMLQWSPDTPSNLPGGYFYPDSMIKGFSLRHFSGRGCVCMQDFAFMPFIGNVTAPPMPDNGFYAEPFSHKNETASPGYYSVRLDNGVLVELTVTRRTGIGKFIFPKNARETLLINGGSSIRGTTKNTSIDIVGNDELRGQATAMVGCGKELYTIYFVARFMSPFKNIATWNGPTISDGERFSDGSKVGAILSFDNSTDRSVEVKVAVSFVSVANAEANLQAEDPGWSFEAVRRSADAAWNKALNKVVVTGGTFAQKQVFYTALYHCYFVPSVFSDVNGEYIGMDGKIHKVPAGHYQYENISGWDAYRTTTPLMALLSPNEESDIAQSLVNDAEQGGGGLPRWEQANHNSGGMVGDGAVIILADAYALGARDFDASAALKAMLVDADKVGATSDGNLVRKGLASYIKLGYVPGSASVTLEYESADYALAQFARAMGKELDYVKFISRACNWKKLYDPSTGYIQPRDRAGKWVEDVTPYTRAGYTEGSASQYTWMVPFDLKGLIASMGGRSRAIERLNHYFTHLNAGDTSPFAFMGNEPCEGDPWVYDYAGAPWLAQKVVRRIQDELFTHSPSGIPGNDDGGALSSWYVFSALGLYPLVPGAGMYVLGSPLFPKAVLHLKNGTVTIIGQGAATGDPYLHSLKVDGRAWHRPWIGFSNISHSAILRFVLSSTPDRKWGSSKADAPPSAR